MEIIEAFCVRTITSDPTGLPSEQRNYFFTEAEAQVRKKTTPDSKPWRQVSSGPIEPALLLKINGKYYPLADPVELS